MSQAPRTLRLRNGASRPRVGLGGWKARSGGEAKAAAPERGSRHALRARLGALEENLVTGWDPAGQQ